MIKHLVFDFDGTISDSYPIFMEFFKTYAKENSLPLPDDDFELLKLLLISVKDAFFILKWDAYVEYPIFRDEFFAFQRKSFVNYRVFPATVDLLKTATEKGIHCYVYTHSGKVVPELLLPNMGIDKYITFTIDKSMDFPEKPAPDALLFLIDKFGLNPEECMMIGDRPIDAQCGMNAGMKGCLWDTYGIFKDTKVDFYVTHLEDVKKYL